MALPDVKLPPVASLVAAIRIALIEGAAECRRLAETASEPFKAELLAAAAKLEDVLQSTEILSLGLAAVAEVQQMWATGKAPVRHDVTDAH